MPLTSPSAETAPSGRPSISRNGRARSGALAAAEMDLVARHRLAARRHAGRAPGRVVLSGVEHRRRRRAARGPVTVPACPSTPSGSAIDSPEHLVAAAKTEHGAAAPAMREDVDVPALAPQRLEIGDRRLRAGQQHQVAVAGDRPARLDDEQPRPPARRAADRGRRNWRCAADAARRCGACCFGAGRSGSPSTSSAGKPRGVGKMRDDAERRASRCGASISASPSSNSAASPRKRLIEEALDPLRARPARAPRACRRATR